MRYHIERNKMSRNNSHEPRKSFLSEEVLSLRNQTDLEEVKSELLIFHKRLGRKNSQIFEVSDNEREMNSKFFEEPVQRKMTFFQNISRLDTSIL